MLDFSGENKQSGKVSEIMELNDRDNLNETNLIEIRIPKNFKEAVKTLEASKWRKAMDQEMQVMYNQEVWDLVKPPKDVQILGNR